MKATDGDVKNAAQASRPGERIALVWCRIAGDDRRLEVRIGDAGGEMLAVGYGLTCDDARWDAIDQIGTDAI